MLIEKWVKSKYSYICLLTAWLLVDSWLAYQFQFNINSNQQPSIVKDRCESILSYLFYANLFFMQVATFLSAIILISKKNGFYFVLTYVVYTVLTILNSFHFSSSLIQYSQQQGVWAGGSPMGDFLHVFLLAIVGIFIVFPYLLFRLFLWLKAIILNQK
jgi:hypothetical protein